MSDDNVVFLDITTCLDIPAERVLQDALGVGMKEVVIIGYDKDGLEYFASSVADGAQANWHLDRAKTKLLRKVEG